MKKILILFCLVNISCDLSGYKPKDSDLIMHTTWELDYAIYQKKILPKGNLNYDKHFIVSGDNNGNFISTYKNKVLDFKEYIDPSKNRQKNSFIEYYLKNNTSVKVIFYKSPTRIEVSNFMKGQYSSKNDTIRYFYKWAKPFL